MAQAEEREKADRIEITHQFMVFPLLHLLMFQSISLPSRINISTKPKKLNQLIKCYAFVNSIGHFVISKQVNLCHIDVKLIMYWAVHFTRVSLMDGITWTKKRRDFLIVPPIKALLIHYLPANSSLNFNPMEFHHVNNMEIIYCQWQTTHYIHFMCTMSSEVVINVIAHAWWSKMI